MEPFTYVWNIHRAYTKYYELLTCGYMRTELKRYIVEKSNNNEIYNISNACLIFVHDVNILNTLKDKSFDVMHYSPLFCIGPFKWIISIIKQADKFVIKSMIQSAAPIFDEIRFKWKYEMKENNISSPFEDESCYPSYGAKLGFHDIEHDKYIIKIDDIQSLNTMTIQVIIKDIQIKMKKNDDSGDWITFNNDINKDNIKQISCDKAYNIIDNYKWRINKADLINKNGDLFWSPIFEMHSIKWYLRFNFRWEGELQIIAVSLPTNISKFYFRYDIISTLFQGNLSEFVGAFNDGEKIIDHKYFSLKYIENIDTDIIEIDVMLSIIDMYDADGNNVTMKNVSFNEECKEIDVSSYDYTWHIPSISKYELDLLFTGYVGENYKNRNVSSDVITLFILFFYEEEDIINIMKNAHTDEAFKSNVFVINGFKFYMSIIPNSYNPEYCTYDDYLGWDCYLHLSSLSDAMSCIKCEYKINVLNTELSQRVIKRFGDCHDVFSYCKYWLIMSSKEMKDRLANRTSYKVELKILAVYDKNGNEICDYSQYLSNITNRNDIKSYQYTWNVQKTSMTDNECIVCSSPIFDMHSFKWVLALTRYPQDYYDRIMHYGEELYLNLKLQSMPIDISCIWCRIEHSFDEIELSNDWDVQFNHDHLSLSRYMYKNHGCVQLLRFKYKDIEQLDKLTFNLSMQLTDVYDKNGYRITHKYVFH